MWTLATFCNVSIRRVGCVIKGGKSQIGTGLEMTSQTIAIFPPNFFIVLVESRRVASGQDRPIDKMAVYFAGLGLYVCQS